MRASDGLVIETHSVTENGSNIRATGLSTALPEYSQGLGCTVRAIKTLPAAGPPSSNARKIRMVVLFCATQENSLRVVLMTHCKSGDCWRDCQRRHAQEMVAPADNLGEKAAARCVNALRARFKFLILMT
ncbi:hypothetical protein KMZ68_07510 [Bradyrhizobium sediminis]|uniref:Uncharacterized protein n=1 Tax=Bradyrhizobium sediminis TaxID=2840469 RepID=A0A975RUB6_9BRAD|nr:hypothetical protein [Bradyrhizobium sediminis]QWG19666.1 hypothetical protein KMZ68_07510 [Bradyrhizobium sediminis]